MNAGSIGEFMILAVFLAAMWFLFEHLRRRRLDFDDEENAGLQLEAADWRRRRDALRQELSSLNEEAGRQFLLYEMTTEISRTSDERKAFQLFKKYLKEHARFQNCRLVTDAGEHFDPPAQDASTQVFYIRGEDERKNFLIVEGIDPVYAERVAALGHQFVLVYRRLQLYGRLEEKAVTDDLTGLLRRRPALENLEAVLERSRRNDSSAAFVMIDVDHFKQFNDQHGHLVGDQILRQTAEVIRSSIREIDAAGRYGGEEFCVILPDTHAEGAYLTAERIRKAVEEHIVKVFEAEYRAAISLGVAVFPVHAQSSEDLVECADQALYQAKSQGRNRVCLYDPGIQIRR